MSGNHPEHTVFVLFQRSGIGGFLFLLLAVLMVFSGCGSPQVEKGQSPELLQSEASGGCSGGEKDQYIRAELTFDRTVELQKNAAGQLRITIGGERVSEEDIELKVRKGKTLQITIPVEKVTTGVLTIEPKDESGFEGITDQSGHYAANYFQVRHLVSSGASVETVEKGAGTVISRVTSAVSHRSIIWVRITENGQPVAPDGTGTDIMDDAFAVHEHDFLWATEESTASDLAEMVNKYFSGRLQAEADGSQVTVHSVDGALTGELDMEIYTY